MGRPNHSHLRVRSCPVCGTSLQYKDQRAYQLAVEKNSYCLACRRLPENNPFFGKTHTDETKEKLRRSDKSYTKTEEFRLTMKEANKKYGSNTKPVYDCWVEKYGEQRADELDALRREKWRAKRNPEKKGYVKYRGRHEHRIVMEQILGRPLTYDDVIHHIDGNPTNNNPTNLLLTNRHDHPKIHAQERRENA